ncbi:LysR family transcriptional regulator [Gordonia liuliyuniae]|uniref:LysR family transcriptional regulator n=1 Tax=Gordonia liuliyuniae TaxID=2911517 RepID=A0ABS9IPY9_9ACTN|nr:LysR family transcriptional regulator [Gordonia liuliyuniae]MCF8587625.1 LysR family transcriptional regulator [Gordonia liuliyuniae]
MELHQLRYLVAVADLGSFTAAAARLHVSQSGVSAQIAKLEHEVGHRLLDRRGRTVSATAAGHEVLPHARAALASIATIDAVSDELSGVVRGSLRLGTVIGCTVPGYLAGFAAFRRAHPGVSVSVVESNSDLLIDDLAAGRLDVALVAHTDPLPDEVTGLTVIREPIAVVVPVGHPWAARDSVACAELVDVTVLSLPPGTGVRSALASTCAVARVDVTPAVAAHSPDSVLALAELGSGVGVLTAAMAVGRDALAAIPVTDSVETSLSLAVGSTPSAAARAMTAALANELLPAQ